MARVKFHLDTRPAKDGRCHVKLFLSHNKTTALMTTGVFVLTEHWEDGDSETEPHIKKNCPGHKTMNKIIADKIEIKSLDEIFNYSDRLVQSLKAVLK